MGISNSKDLQYLLENLQPELHSEQYVFSFHERLPLADLSHILGWFKEKEGYAVISTDILAKKRSWDHSIPMAMISLQVQSDLSAVGLTAAVSHALSLKGLPCNVVAGYFHDHLFVPYEKADEAIQVLKDLSDTT